MKKRLALIVGVLMLFALAPANAQVELTSGVARISLIHGDISTQRGDSDDWAAAALNQPVVSGDKVSSGVRSRAEVQLDQANIIRLGDNTLATVASLSRTQIQLQIARGLIDFTVFKGGEADVEIDTANVAIHPAQRDGVYRVEVNPEGETQVIVRKGEAEISTPQGSTRLEKGRMIVVRGTAEQAQYKEEEAPAKDSWDSWNNDRDRTIRDAQSWSHTNRYYVGSEDLDAYGRWVTVPDYGPVWSPYASVGWVPYREGRWVWEPGWGWTWVSYEPWGWAPYHYGRWFVYGGSWVWWPGPVYAAYRPVWAPAYVSFFGFGSGVGFGFGFGSLGWLPVGPCDPFFPWYGRYRSHFNSVNIVNITNVYNFHNGGRGFNGIAPLRTGNGYSNLRRASVDERVRQGISTVRADRFGTGRMAPVGVGREEFNSGRMMAGNLPVVPTREALSVSNRPAAPDTLRQGTQTERFFTKSQPRPGPQSFDRQAAQVRQAIQRDGQFKAINGAPGRGFASAGKTGGNPSGNVAADSSRGAVPRPNPGVRIGENREQNTGSTFNTQHVGRATDNQGWRRFDASGAQNQAASPAARAPAHGTLSLPARNGNGNDRAERPAAAGNQEWRRFSDSAPAQHGTVSAPGPGVMRPENSARPESPANDGGWRHFTPQPARSVQSSPGGIGADRMNGNRGEGLSPSRDQMARPSGDWRSPAQDSPRSYSRPPLEMRQPIVTPRASQGGGGPSPGGAGYGGGGSHSQPSGGGGNHGESGGHQQSHSSGHGRGH
jgi:uncharacterized protein DUF6600/FecR-like protein